VTEAEGSGAKEKDDDNNNEKGIFGALRLFFLWQRHSIFSLGGGGRDGAVRMMRISHSLFLYYTVWERGHDLITICAVGGRNGMLL